MERVFQDQAYIECLPKLYRKHHELWKRRMHNVIDDVVVTLGTKSPEETMAQYQLTPRDIGLMVRLEFFTPEEVERFGLRRIEESARL